MQDDTSSITHKPTLHCQPPYSALLREQLGSFTKFGPQTQSRCQEGRKHHPLHTDLMDKHVDYDDVGKVKLINHFYLSYAFSFIKWIKPHVK